MEEEQVEEFIEQQSKKLAAAWRKAGGRKLNEDAIEALKMSLEAFFVGIADNEMLDLDNL